MVTPEIMRTRWKEHLDFDFDFLIYHFRLTFPTHIVIINVVVVVQLSIAFLPAIAAASLLVASLNDPNVLFHST